MDRNELLVMAHKAYSTSTVPAFSPMTDDALEHFAKLVIARHQEQMGANEKQPMQPVVNVDGVARFKENAIVCHLIDTHPSCDMNKLAGMDFTDEDRMQFAQLIGYSVGGYADLSYVSDESYEAAEKAANGIKKGQE